MCIAIVQLSDAEEISKEVLEVCAENNPDGCGFAYINIDYMGISRLKIWKGMSFSSFYHQYQRARGINPDSPFLIHFRIKTHGTVDKFNCHPFKIDDERVFIHNGTIFGVPNDTIKSDTQMFNETVLKGLPDDWFYNEAIKTLIENFIGNSKLVVLTLDGEVEIYNEGKGKWLGNNWFSNDSYKKRKIYSPPAYSKKYNNFTKNNKRTVNSTSSRSNLPALHKSAASMRSSKIVDLHPLEEISECDWCGSFDSDNVMLRYEMGGEKLTLCDECSQKLKDQGLISSSDLISKEVTQDINDLEEWWDESYYDECGDEQFLNML